MFSKFAKITPVTWGVIAALFIFGIVVFAITKDKKRWTARMLANAALCIALATVLSYVRLYKMPQGGSITPASMLPVMMFAFAFGFGPGLVCAVAYGVLQMFQDMYIVGWVQAMLDYLLAYGALAVVGLFRKWKSPLNFSIGVIVAGLLRITFHVISGVVYFADYAPEGMSPLAYSLGYNLTSAGVDSLICAVIGFIPGVRKFTLKMAERRA